jgi:UDP-N-acetylglucosamine--N-acetylmuramyl-(pentapeptide) pyrophosphoryl-undecaprenol N-acetylglucosamine transferase
VREFNRTRAHLVNQEASRDQELIHFTSISTGKLRRYFDVKNLIDLFRIPFGTFQAWRKLRPTRVAERSAAERPTSARLTSPKVITKQKPNLVFSKGGFVGVPVVWAAWLRKIPVVIHESDAIPGLATKLTAPFAKAILLAYDQARPALKKYEKKIHIVGNPVRPEIFTGSKEKALKWTGFTGEKPVLIIMGGSSGAQELNHIVREEKERLSEIYDVIHITGKGKGNAQKFPNYISVPYVHEELKDLYALVTHVITRAGANTLAELEALGIPSLLYPLGHHQSRGDQWRNATAMIQQCDYVRIASRENTAHSQLILLPQRRHQKKRQNSVESIAMLLMSILEDFM